VRSSLRRRLELLEAASDDSSPRQFDWNSLRAGAAIDWTPFDEAAHHAARESHPAAVLLRRQFKNLGIPQPSTLEGVDVVAECIRLAGVPDRGGVTSS
jgi:hypothetical protein